MFLLHASLVGGEDSPAPPFLLSRVTSGRGRMAGPDLPRELDGISSADPATLYAFGDPRSGYDDIAVMAVRFIGSRRP
jgi:hypothetical protein